MKAGRTVQPAPRHGVAGRTSRVITMTCSFTADTDGYVYDLCRHPRRRARARRPARAADRRGRGRRPVGRRAGSGRARSGPTAPARRPIATGSAARDARRRPAPAHRAARLRHRLDRHRRAAAPPRGRHHRHDQPRSRRLVPPPARADEWLLQDVQSLVNAGGRGTLRGVIRDTAGHDRRVDGAGDAAAASL